jgi:hypothetical protein
LPDQRHEPGLERGDQFLDRAGAGAHLQRGAGHEAAAGEGTALQVIKECLAHSRELGPAGRSDKGGPHDFFLEDPASLLDGRQLKFLLGAEMRVQAALAHADRRGQVPDRQALQPVHGRQRGGRAQDRGAGAFPVGAGAALRMGACHSAAHRLDKIARPVVLSH